MAKFLAEAGNGGNMLYMFMWPTYGIDSITDVGGGTWEVKSPGAATLDIYYNGTGITDTGTGIPTAGAFNEATLYFSGVQQGFFSQITRINNFKEIDDGDRFRILDGNDILTGALDKADVLFGGFGGSDNFQGKGGGDEYIVATLATRPTHVISGDSDDTDTLTVWQNTYQPGSHTLDLTQTTLFSIERLKLDPGVTVLLRPDQFEPVGLSPFAAVEGGAGSQVVVNLPAPGTLDLSGLSLSGGARLVLGGTDGGDMLLGSGGTDSLLGNAGIDVLNAGPGADILRGGSEADVLTGGPGADMFDFDSVADIGKKKGTRDLITDYEKGIDRIDLTTIDPKGKPGDQPFKFIKKADFSGKAGELHFLKINKPGTANDVTRVEGDTDGNGKADFKLELTGLYKLTVADFVL